MKVAVPCCLAALVLCTVTSGALAQTPQDASYFAWLPRLDAGWVVLSNPHGGQYVYASSEPSDGRLAQRFSIGVAARTEFVLFSADEEAALWALRDRQRFPHAYLPAQPMRYLPPPTAAPRAPIDWPKVVIAEGRTCVPELAFADSPDWRAHLVCWVGSTREVRHD